MKRITFWGAILLVAWVIYNVCTRESKPAVHADILLPFLEGHELINAFIGLLLKPGAYVLWYLGLSLQSRIELIVAALLSWWTYLIAARLIRRVLLLEG